MNKIIASSIINQYPEANHIIHELTTDVKYDLPNNTSLYFGFPRFIGYEDNSIEPDLLILSQKHGICIIRFTHEELGSEEINEITDELYSLIFSKLTESKILREKRGAIKIPLEAYIFASNSTAISEYKVSSIEEISEKLNQQKNPELFDDILINEAKSIIEGTKALSSFSERKIDENDTTSKAFIISQLENEIKNFDFEQLQSAITIIDGPQRIRGLAGSGKTVVLAMKAAQIHLNEPDKMILFTFYTKSLYQQIKDLITKFYRHYKKTDPNWNNIHIKHAWGGQGVDGVYYSSCVESGINTINFGEANRVSSNPFDFVCKKALDSGKLREKYDYILIDEAQDLPTHFFRLIYNIAKFNPNITNEKNIIWGYDDLQNIFNVKTKSPQELFGSDSDGLDFIDLERAFHKIPPYLNNDIVLHKCYRNPRSVLLVAHSLGFGFYNSEGNLPVQILENKEHWEDLGYKVLSGNIQEGQEVEVERPEEYSPLSIGKYTDEKGLIQFFKATDLDNETDWIISEIENFLSEGLNPEDILLISLDDRNAKTYFSDITSKLLPKNIFTNNLLLNPYTSTNFVNKGHITLSTVHRAKGNEAPIVFVLGIDSIYKERKSRRGRNKIFTAFTRTKCCLRVSGIKGEAQYFYDEISATLEDYPSLKFIQPEKELVETIQRDLNDKSKKIKDMKKDFYDRLKKEGFSDEEIVEELKGINKI